MQAQQELDRLRSDLTTSEFNDADSAQRLLRLKLLARDPASAPCVYCPDGLRILSQIAFDLDGDKGPYEASSLEAAKVIANALLLRDATQQMFADIGYTNRLVQFYNRDSANHEFVGGRILFLLTYKSNVDYADLVEHQDLAKHIDRYLLGHATNISTGVLTEEPMSMMALTETLKLVYNIASKHTAPSDIFTELTSTLIRILSDLPIPSTPLGPPVTQILNALGIIEWPTSLGTETTEPGVLQGFAKKLVTILDRSISSLPPAELDSVLIAPLTVLRKMSILSHGETSEFLQQALLPQDVERDKPLGQSQTLASRLLQLQGSAGVMLLPEAISGLLFDLSDRDASIFVRNIGYGHAAGYLMSHHIPIPEDMTADLGVVGANGTALELNPITGQRLDAETPVSLPDMTDEEKEREAERLFVLFERMRATGVVSVENPITNAKQSGRFEELSDHDSDA